ncbi:MAG: nucleotidyltransferase family protein [Kineosporiaceae bacterium]
MSGSRNDDVQPLLEALKTVASAFKADRVPFALAGQYAVYARGGQSSRHDVDFVLPPEALPAATAALEARGFDVVQPPEDWLAKVYVEGELVDLIHTLASGPVDDQLLGRAERLRVESIEMPVLSATDLVVGKLLALSEHACNLEPALAVMRNLREQLDLDVIARACQGRPFAQACLGLARDLGVLPTRHAGHEVIVMPDPHRVADPDPALA